MLRSLRHPGLLLWGLALMGATLLATPTVTGATGDHNGNNTGCFHVRVEFVGRVPVQNIGGVQYYRWSYRVYGDGCINRGLSHWVLGLCGDTQKGLTQVSTRSVDNTDPTGGQMSHYTYVLGKDPTTNVNGIKWNFVCGNQINKVSECDEFSFVATGEPTPMTWAAKGARIVVTGTVPGPGCSPVPTEQVTWGQVKSLFR